MDSAASKRYRTIVADPPWEYEGFVPSRTGERFWHRPLPYAMLSLDEIAALPIATLADSDSRLFLWTTNRYLGAAFDIARRWGFEYQQTLVWRKTGNPSPMGGSVAPNHAEYLLVSRRGFPARLDRLSSSVIDAPKLAHSRKPELFLDEIERVSPGPFLELFARRQRLGWDTWGNEALEHVDLGESA
jgi:N6-adenosine-specific RNA methylase IME4